MSASEWEWRGEPGHFICADRCLFRMHTHVAGRYCVSTVGEMESKERELETIGVGRLYETMVFELDSDGGHDGIDIDFAPYNNREAARSGHMDMCKKWDL